MWPFWGAIIQSNTHVQLIQSSHQPYQVCVFVFSILHIRYRGISEYSVVITTSICKSTIQPDNSDSKVWALNHFTLMLCNQCPVCLSFSPNSKLLKERDHALCLCFMVRMHFLTSRQCRVKKMRSKKRRETTKNNTQTKFCDFSLFQKRVMSLKLSQK